jgi:O-succinylbenzoic acid--CoA ligase
VVAVVCLASRAASLELEEARDWVSARHPRAWAPRELVVVPTMPMLPNGKVDRIAVRELARAAG